MIMPPYSDDDDDATVLKGIDNNPYRSPFSVVQNRVKARSVHTMGREIEESRTIDLQVGHQWCVASV